ncbi:unnamed protein product [Peniophora sp. CBMAI 1063]|nr:unnamed protein product [Peniophora sp. CBMAI 1063]
MDTLLERSRQLPLHFGMPRIDWHAPVREKYDPYWYKHRGKIDFAIQHLDRAASLKLLHPVGSPRDVDWRAHLSHTSLPKLFSLAIYQPHVYSQKRLFINAPNLREAVVNGRAMPLFPTTMTMLRTLEISLSSAKISFSSFHPILNVLRGTPLLEELLLKRIFCFIDGDLDEPATSQEPVKLARLRTAVLDITQPEEWGSFWSKLNVPDDTNLCLIVSLVMIDVAAALYSTVSHLRRPDYDKLTLTLSDNFVHLDVSPAEVPITEKGLPNGGQIRWDDTFHVSYIMGSLPRFVETTNIHILDLRFDVLLRPPSELAAFLDNFQNVTTVYLDVVVSTLFDNDPPTQAPIEATLVFGWQSHSFRNLSIIWDIIIAYAHGRVASGQPLKVLELLGGQVENGRRVLPIVVENQFLKTVSVYVDKVIDRRCQK